MGPVILINPSAQHNIYQELATEWTAIEPPIWCRLLASYLRNRGVPVDIFDSQAFPTTNQNEIAKYCEIPEPSVYVVVVMGQQPSASTQTMPVAIELCKAIRERDDGKTPIVVVGTHPAALPEQTLKETQADFVCTGEGFATIKQIHELVQHHKDRWRYCTTPNWPEGVCKWDHDEPVFSNPAANVWELDTAIPGGVWNRLPMKDTYRAHNWHCFGYKERTPYASIYTSLGCPYSCEFCCIQAPFKEGDRLRVGNANSYRVWSARHVVNELATLARNYGVRHVKISDEMFLLKRSHVAEICDEIISRNLAGHFNFWFYSRVDTVGTDDALLDKMKKCGFNWAALGIEAAEPQVLGNVDKRDYDALECVNAVRRLQKHGINVIGNYIFGLPGETQESMEKTMELALWAKTEFVNMYCAVAFPGSKLFSRMAWEKADDASALWRTFSFHGYEHLPLSTERLTASEILKYRDAAFQRYMNDPGYLGMIQSKFGKETREQVARMASVKLRRKVLNA